LAGLSLIDLHTHTNESDGSFSPAELIEEAMRAGVGALAITDHDTFAGYDEALPLACQAGVELVRGIELSTKLLDRSVHLLGYFPGHGDLEDLRAWVLDLQTSRRERNVRLAARLRELGMDIRVEEAEALGRGMTGRPHFARIMVQKGYVASIRKAFDDYLDESAKGYVYRREPHFTEGVRRIRAAGGVASLAHPTRVVGDVTALLPDLCAAGLNAIEAYHSDHTPAETDLYLGLARRHALRVTGGSDFHGAFKPEVMLGTGRQGNLSIPGEVLEQLAL
jgi:predicted metal-dependent phosphoesterase TrpH